MLTNKTMAMGFSLLTCLLLAGGCTSYYKVKDPQSGKVYYTTDMNQRTAGAVTLKDGKTGDQVTLQNSHVQKIDKKTYESSRQLSGEDPEAKAKEAQARAAEQQRIAAAKAAEAKAAEAAVAAGAAASVKPAVTSQQMRASLVAGSDQVDRTLKSLAELTDPNQTDLQAAYKRYGEQVDRMKLHAAQTKADADSMRQTREAYFAKWDSKVASTDNPTIRAEAEAKRARLRAGQEKIVADSALAKEAYQPFITDLEDTRKFLANDISKDAISVLAPTVRKANQNGQTLKQRLDTLIDDIDAVEMVPTTKPSPTGASGGSAPKTAQPAPASPASPASPAAPAAQ